MLRTILPLLLACAGILAGPTQAAPPTPPPEARVEAAMALPAPLRRELQALELDQGGLSQLDRVQRLFEYMVATDGMALHYREQPTHGIAESYAQREVNCLSFTMMYIALARAAGLDAFAQASEDALAMRLGDDTLVRARHVKVGVDIGGRQYTVDVGWRSVVAERRPRRITDAQLVALLHNNNAVEHLERGDQAGAAAGIAEAMALDDGSATIWNNAGVIYSRSGRRKAAEQAYLRALDIEEGHIGALGNLVHFYRANGEKLLAARYAGRLRRAQASDPFSQYLQAQQLARLGDWDAALLHYRRAIRLLPNLPRFHRSLAEAYRALGEARAAERTLRHARELEQRRYSQRSIPGTRPGSG